MRIDSAKKVSPPAAKPRASLRALLAFILGNAQYKSQKIQV
jgi:hypothetical protein